MQNVEIHMPENLEAAIMAVIDQRIQKVLDVAPNLPQQIRFTAVFRNIDVDGNPMPYKKPRPKGLPTNNPAIPLIQTGDMMDPARWHQEQVDPHFIDIIYSPPPYFDYVVAQGRPWMTRSKINDEVRRNILQMMRRAIGESL